MQEEYMVRLCFSEFTNFGLSQFYERCHFRHRLPRQRLWCAFLQEPLLEGILHRLRRPQRLRFHSCTNHALPIGGSNRRQPCSLHELLLQENGRPDVLRIRRLSHELQPAEITPSGAAPMPINKSNGPSGRAAQIAPETSPSPMSSS